MNEWILFFVVLFLFLAFIKVWSFFEKDKQFRKNIKVGDRARFYVDEEAYIGNVTKVHHPFVDFDYFDETYTDFISSIYPA